MTEAHKNARTRAIELRYAADEIERKDKTCSDEVRIMRLAACELERMHAECEQAWIVLDLMRKTITKLEAGGKS
jgi:hypothetical protein